jgi:hypothetical protein
MKPIAVMTVWLFMLFGLPVHAQGDNLWCEVGKPDTPPFRSMTVAEDAPQIMAIVPLPPNGSYNLWYQDAVKISADGTRAVTSIRDKDSWKEELVGVNLVDEKVYFRLSTEEIETLRPATTDEPDFEGVLLRRVDWLGTSNRLGVQTGYICHGCGEETPPPDDLHIVDEAGHFLTLLKPGDGGYMLPSPDGEYVLMGGPNRLSLLRTDGSYRRDNLIPDYHARISIFGTSVLHAYWESNESVLVFDHPDVSTAEPHIPIQLWRVRVEDPEPEPVRAFEGVFDDLEVDPSGGYFAYQRLIRVSDDRDVPRVVEMVIQNLDSGAEWIVQSGKWRFYFHWTQNVDSPTLNYFREIESERHFVGLCGA